jgi:DNA-3-methyladenine glycosylase II
MKPEYLTEATLASAAAELAERDRDLRRIFTSYGPPPLWARKPGFPTLIKIILEQQVSLRSAASMFARLRQNVAPFNAARFCELGPDFFRSLGVTRQKTAYCLHLAEALVSKQLRLSRLHSLSDEEVKAELMKLKGIGSWSADIYLLMALQRPDIWPSGDLALAAAVADVRRMDGLPRADELESLAKRWKPYRAVAARMLWQYYLAKRNGKTGV